LYNSLRSSPANSIALDQLMKMYATMQAYDQAIAAASDFPQALHNSEQCMTTLGRVYLAQNKFNEATQWLAAAVDRNPQLGEAQYYKALAHLMSTPPDYPAAITAARAARSTGYPQAEALLRQAEAKARGE
jgi:tetratricopeptide (TPR) repeat protein